MIIKSKKIILSFVASLGCLIILINALDNKKNTVTKEINPGIISYFNLDTITFDTFSSMDEFKLLLNNAEKSIWLNIKEVYNFTQEELLQHKKELYNEYQIMLNTMSKKYSDSQKALEKETINDIQSIIRAAGANPDQIQLVPWNIQIPASATDFIIFVNEKMFNELSQKTKKFIIGHELVHYINQDHSTRWVLRNTQPIKQLSDTQKILDKLCKFQELRADILCTIKGSDYALGAIDFMQSQIRKYGEIQLDQRNEYPTYAMREAINAKIFTIHNTFIAT